LFEAVNLSNLFFVRRNFDKFSTILASIVFYDSMTRCTRNSGRIPMVQGRGLPALCGAPDPGPRPSGDQGIYLACLPVRNIRPSHSPSTWAGPAPAWWLGIVSTHRTSHVRPIQLAQPARTTHARSSLSRRDCILRGSRTACGPPRFETQGCAADGTADSPELLRAVTSASMWE
jgi:hypothetical protein